MPERKDKRHNSEPKVFKRRRKQIEGQKPQAPDVPPHFFANRQRTTQSLEKKTQSPSMYFGIGIPLPEILKFFQDNWQVITGISGGGGIVGLTGYILKHRREVEGIANQRFQDAIAGLASSEIDAKAAGATQLLHILRHAGHERFDQQIFQIAVNHFRNRKVTINKEGKPQPSALDQAFLPVFIEGVSRVREGLKKAKAIPDEYDRYLNASSVHLDGLSFPNAKLQSIVLVDATFTFSDLFRTELTNANLYHANLMNAYLQGTRLYNANLNHTNLTNARLLGTHLNNADLTDANLTNAGLSFADLSGAGLWGANLTDAEFPFSNLTDVKDLDKAILTRTKMYSGDNKLSDEQIADCKAKGAIFDVRPLKTMSNFYNNT